MYNYPASSSARHRPAGIGLRTPHYRNFLETKPPVGFVEVHSENFFDVGGLPMALLEHVRSSYHISLHGVGLSLGGAERLNRRHIMQLRELVGHIDPWLVSDHLAWVGIDGLYANDLLPVPLTPEALRVVVDHVDQVQQVLGRQILIENPSSYLAFAESTMAEPDFLSLVVEATGCALLLDVNNIYVSAVNLGFDAAEFLALIPEEAVAEIHLAGHTGIGSMLVDTHSKPVAEPVWDLYRAALTRFGDAPALIEWDTDLPPLATLLGEAAMADAIRSELHPEECRHALAA